MILKTGNLGTLPSHWPIDIQGPWRFPKWFKKNLFRFGFILGLENACSFTPPSLSSQTVFFKWAHSCWEDGFKGGRRWANRNNQTNDMLHTLNCHDTCSHCMLIHIRSLNQTRTFMENSLRFFWIWIRIPVHCYIKSPFTVLAKCSFQMGKFMLVGASPFGQFQNGLS